MPYSGYKVASCPAVPAVPAVAVSAFSASFAIVLPVLGGAAKSIVMTLTPASDTWLRSIDWITDRAFSCKPDGSTGRVSHTLSLGSAFSTAAMAWARRCPAAKSSSAAPSMSRSITVRW
jgi:hypothetical protein